MADASPTIIRNISKSCTIGAPATGDPKFHTIVGNQLVYLPPGKVLRDIDGIYRNLQRVADGMVRVRCDNPAEMDKLSIPAERRMPDGSGFFGCREIIKDVTATFNSGMATMFDPAEEERRRAEESSLREENKSLKTELAIVQVEKQRLLEEVASLKAKQAVAVALKKP